jgi:hypothetical protein
MSVLIKGLLNPFPFRPTHLPHSPIVLNLLVPFQSWVDFITGIDQRLAVLQTPLLSFLASTGLPQRLRTPLAALQYGVTPKNSVQP